MPLVQVVLVLIVVGVLLWLINRFIPMQETIKSILNGVGKSTAKMRRLNIVDAGGKAILTVISQFANNSLDPLRGFPLGKDDFGETTTGLPVQVDRGIGQIADRRFR